MTVTRATAGFLVAAMATLLVVPALHYGGLNMDEGLLLLYPERLLGGAVPNRDFLMSYGPGDMWTLASLYAVFGTQVAVERLAGAAFHTVIAVAVFAHASRWGSTVAVLAGLIAGALLVPLGAVAFAFVGALALVLTSLFVLSARSDVRTTVVAGVLAGLAIDFRPELVVAATLAMLPFAVGSGRRRQAALVGGATVALLPFGVHVLVAGPAPVFDNLVLGVFKWGSARYLPLPGRDPVMLVALAITDVLLLLAATDAFRSERSPRSRALLGLAVFSLLTLPQALQRADLFHLALAGTVPMALLPVTVLVLLRRVRRIAAGPRRELAAGLIAAVVVALAAPGIVERAALIEVPRAVGLQRYDVFAVEHRGRLWYPIRAGADFNYTPDGSEASLAELQDTLDDVEQIAAPEARLFVGPLDLRRTMATDTVIYWLLPRLVPATYYLEMAPGSTNGPDSHLAADIAAADLLVLTTRYDDWIEPNASQLLGSDAPNVVVRDRFELHARHGSYSIYVRRTVGVASARDGSTFR